MDEVINTERLVLRPPVMADAPVLAREANDIEVARWLVSMPHPYSHEDAEAFIARHTPGKSWMITRENTVIGLVGLKGEFGYWLGRSHWGQGYATEAARAVLERYFALHDAPVVSGYFLGNETSRHVLSKLGFRKTHQSTRVHAVTGAQVSQQFMELTKAHWREASMGRDAMSGTAAPDQVRGAGDTRPGLAPGPHGQPVDAEVPDRVRDGLT